MKICLVILTRRSRTKLTESQCKTLIDGIIVRFNRKLGSASLLIPTFELTQINVIGILNRFNEIIRGNSLPIMSVKIEIRAFSKAFLANQRLDHAHDFCTFLVYGDCVEITDLNIRVWSHRMRHRASIFCKLHTA